MDQEEFQVKYNEECRLIFFVLEFLLLVVVIVSRLLILSKGAMTGFVVF